MFLQPQNFLPLIGPVFVTVLIKGYMLQKNSRVNRLHPLEMKEPKNDCVCEPCVCEDVMNFEI